MPSRDSTLDLPSGIQSWREDVGTCLAQAWRHPPTYLEGAITKPKGGIRRGNRCSCSLVSSGQAEGGKPGSEPTRNSFDAQTWLKRKERKNLCLAFRLAGLGVVVTFAVLVAPCGMII